MADVSLRGVTGCFGGQVACTPVRPVGFDAAGGRILDGDLYRSAPHG